MELVVKEPFGGYKKGDRITDPVKITTVLTSNPSHVIKVADTPAQPVARAPTA